MPKPIDGSVGSRKVNPGGFVWWGGDTWTLPENVLVPRVGRTVHVVEIGGGVYIGGGDEMADYASAELVPAVRCTVQAAVEVADA